MNKAVFVYLDLFLLKHSETLLIYCWNTFSGEAINTVYQSSNNRRELCRGGIKTAEAVTRRCSVKKVVRPKACNFIKKETLKQVFFSQNTSGGCFFNNSF